MPIIILLTVIAITIFSLSAFFVMTAGLKIDEQKLVNIENGYEYYDSCGNLFATEFAGNSVTSGEKIPEHVKNAFIAIEDKRFYSHKGIDFKAVLRSVVNNIKNRSFKEGGSTITQQLVKNTHLSGEKTFKRKISEMRLAVELEKKYDKNEILEKYLNTIYFGSGAYGISEASKTYFEKTPDNLSVNEAAVLAAIVKAPSQYSPITHKEKCVVRKNLVLKEMLLQNYIDENEFKLCSKSFPEIKKKNSPNNCYDYTYLVKNEVASLSGGDDFGYYNGKKKIYTSYEKDNQEILESAIKNSCDDCEKTAILLNKEGKIVAYYSTTSEQKRQAGSSLKPLLVYAPAIETGAVYEMSPVLDEKTDFGGYSPSNYNEKYYGYMSVKESLSKSSNVCAVKILNYIGIENSKKFLEKTNIELTEHDNSLCIALGCTEKGVFLKDLAAAYGIFCNRGIYCPPTTIDSRSTTQFAFIRGNDKSRIFSAGTCDIMNDMLNYTVKNGTAKKLSFLDLPIYAKTGTVGTKNGNTDAYCMSYSSEYVLGVWCGNKDHIYMNNSVSGGTLPAQISSEIWSLIYRDRKPAEIEKSAETVELDIDKISYDNDRTLILADDNAPERFVLRGLFTKNNIPKIKSERFTRPTFDKCELSVSDYGICVRLCLTELYGANIYKRIENGKKELLCEVQGSDTEEICRIDDNVVQGKVYFYSIVPYYKNGAKIFYGEETEIGKIKTPQQGGAENWWQDDFY